MGARRRFLAATWEEAASCVELPHWVRLLAILYYYTGLRVKQARSLTRDDVHCDDTFARQNRRPVLWVGHGKTPAEGDGRYLPIQPALARWLRGRRAAPGTLDDLPGDLRRTDSLAYEARAAGLAEGRIAWEVGDLNVSLQLSKAWKEAGVPTAV